MISSSTSSTWTADSPMVIVCLARPELLDERPGWPGERIELEPLREEEAEAILSALGLPLAPGQAPPIAETPRAIRSSSSSSGRLRSSRSGDDARFRPRSRPFSPPGSTGWRPEERAVLEAASVVGKEFWRRALLHLLPGEKEVSALLQRLVRRRLVRPEHSSFPGEDAFRFGHILIRDAAYGGIPKGTRANLHERFADWLELSGSPYEEIIGYHLEQAVHYRRELGATGEEEVAIAARGGKLLAAEGRRAAARGDYLAAANLLERAGALLPSDTSEAVELQIELGAAFALAGRLARAEDAFSEADEGATRRGDDRLLARATLQRAFLDRYLHPERGCDELRRAAERAIEVFEAAGDNIGLARAWRLLAEVHWTRLQVERMEDALRRAHAYAELGGAEPEILLVLDGLARAAVAGPLPVGEAVLRCQEIVERAAGHRGLVANVNAMRAYLEAMRGDFETARQLADDSSSTLAELGAVVDLAALRAWIGEVDMLSEDPKRGEEVRHAAYTALDGLGERAILSTIAAYLAEALYAQGRDEEALALTTVSAESAGKDDVTSQILWRVTAAKLKARVAAFRRLRGWRMKQ